MQATRANLSGALKNEAISERLRHWQLRDYMVATQVGLSTLLLVCSVLVVRSLQRALEAPIGYNPKGAVSASFDLNIQGYEVRGREFQRRLFEKVRAIPAWSRRRYRLATPLMNLSSEYLYRGRAHTQTHRRPQRIHFAVSPDYFRTMQTGCSQAASSIP